MSDMPERIWALPDWDKDTRGTWESAEEYKALPDHVSYHRADAPLTPAEAMARCPEVAFAVAALQHAAQNMPHPDQMIDDALAPFTKS